MSGKLVTLINDADLTLAEAAVLRVIADFSDDYGEGCWAGYVRLCRSSKLKRRAAIETIKRLERKGIISVVGKHPVYGTNRWKIHIDRIPMLPSWEVWKAEFSRAHKGREGSDGAGASDGQEGAPDAQPDEIEDAGAPDAPGGCIACALPGAVAAPDPQADPQESTSDSELPAAEPAGAGAREPWDDDPDQNQPVHLRPSRDYPATHGDDEGGERDERLPQTPLEVKLVSLVGAPGQGKYLGGTIAQARKTRALLNTPVIGGRYQEMPRTLSSPEEVWLADPEGFSAYADVCARVVKSRIGGANPRVSMQALVSELRMYGRVRTGWLDYQEARARAQKVSRPDVDPDHWVNQVRAINT